MSRISAMARSAANSSTRRVPSTMTSWTCNGAAPVAMSAAAWIRWEKLPAGKAKSRISPCANSIPDASAIHGAFARSLATLRVSTVARASSRWCVLAACSVSSSHLPTKPLPPVTSNRAPRNAPQSSDVWFRTCAMSAWLIAEPWLTRPLRRRSPRCCGPNIRASRGSSPDRCRPRTCCP